jgi:hypothetical protein
MTCMQLKSNGIIAFCVKDLNTADNIYTTKGLSTERLSDIHNLLQDAQNKEKNTRPQLYLL